jgi:hypothetical protein
MTATTRYGVAADHQAPSNIDQDQGKSRRAIAASKLNGARQGHINGYRSTINYAVGADQVAGSRLLLPGLEGVNPHGST